MQHGVVNLLIPIPGVHVDVSCLRLVRIAVAETVDKFVPPISLLVHGQDECPVVSR